ncbi:MAG: MarR family winged helix-turn-helix transcriptional regulator [Solirubrobacteraceae bacterium]
MPTREQLSAVAEEVLDAAITASRALVGLAARSLAEADEEVTLPQYRMLVVLGTRGPRPASLLAAALGVAAPTATRMCDRLVRKGLITRRGNERDRRQVLLGLTPRGQELLDRVTSSRRAEITALLREIPRERHASLVEGFRLFAEAAGELAEADWAAGWDL